MNGMDPTGGQAHPQGGPSGGFCEPIHPGQTMRTALLSILEGVDHVDFLDIDAQGAEEFMLRKPADRAAFRRKVRRTHIETHTDNIWKEVADGLLELGFLIVQNTTWMYEWPRITQARMARTGGGAAGSTPSTRRLACRVDTSATPWCRV